MQQMDVSARALKHNVSVLRGVLTPATKLAAVVKANAYGHGLAEVVQVVSELVDWLAVHTPEEAAAIRALGISKPILVMGFAMPEQLRLLDDGCHLVVSSVEVVGWLGELRQERGVAIPVHLKVETGTNRQGVRSEDIPAFCTAVRRAGLQVAGVAMHFANIEDTLEHDFAREQLERFRGAIEVTERALGHRPPWIHSACSAAALLFRDADFTLARVGISLYGHWPSRETRLSWMLEHGTEALELEPVLTWRTVVGQVKRVPAGETVGYGRSWQALRDTVLAVLPVGYADGYPRALGNRARVLVKGVPAPVVGRVCMNIMMVDVTDIPGVRVGDPVVLLGREGTEAVTAEELASLSGTINYEILARLSPVVPRRVVEG